MGNTTPTWNDTKTAFFLIGHEVSVTTTKAGVKLFTPKEESATDVAWTEKVLTWKSVLKGRPNTAINRAFGVQRLITKNMGQN